MVAMFPANVYAAIAGVVVNGAPATALLPRTLMQLVFIGATVLIALPYTRMRTRRGSSSTHQVGTAETGATY
jgi:uncharacterized membrane protein